MKFIRIISKNEIALVDKESIIAIELNGKKLNILTKYNHELTYIFPNDDLALKAFEKFEDKYV